MYNLIELLNNRIHKIERSIIPKVIKIDEELIKKVKDKCDDLYDYELEIEIIFYLSNEHSNYDKNEDNILTTLSESVKNISVSKDFYPYNETNHNDFVNWDNHIFKGQYHCWWFHCLYDHTNLDFEDLLNIGDIFFDIHIRYQYLYEK